MTLARTKPLLGLLLLAIAACGGEEDETEVAVSNGNPTASIDAVISDGDTELRFEGVAAGTTSTFQIASFESFSGLTVRVGGVSSTIALSEGSRNLVNVAADGTATSVPLATSSGGGEGGW
jgi:hypothetical protein